MRKCALSGELAYDTGVIESAEQAIAGKLQWQADACRMIGSPLYAELMERAAADVEAHGPAWEVLRGHEDDPEFSVLGLRLLGAVNRLVLTGREPALADAYDMRDGPTAWELLRDVLARNAGDLRLSLELPVQTNEVGRSAVLLSASSASPARPDCRCACWRSVPAPASTCAGTASATRPMASPGGRPTHL